MMPKQYKVNACLTLVLVVLFYLFWQLCKQQIALANVATFTEDPYDAVGSFATQFAIFTALLTMIRAFRPYQPGSVLDRQQILLVRGEYLTCLSVAVTLGADVVAMLRYPSVWIGHSAGYLLASLVVGMALLTALVGWYIRHTARESRVPSAYHGWALAIGISLLGAIICALYPENWRQIIPLGGFWTAFIFFTVIVGMIFFFASVWAWGKAISPTLETIGEDFIDDLAALYQWLKTHVGPFNVLLIPFEKLLGSSFLRPIVNALNPRKSRWYGIAIVGICIGAVLAFSEVGLNIQLSRIEIFAGIECLAVLMGYAFLANLLGLSRQDSDNKLSRSTS